MHLHLMGICGTFMGGLALIARAAGHRVTGCDQGVYPPMSTQLQDQGIELIEGFDADQLALKPDLFVVGNVISRGNPLMEAILNNNAAFVSGPQWLGQMILKDQHVLAVAGTHGKTTTSAMLAWILQVAGQSPNFLIGGVAPGLGVSARYDPNRQHFVIEADEYDTAFFDKRSKFVHYRARTAILNNLEYDHADIFADLAAIETQFHHLVRTVPSAGKIIMPDQDQALERVIARGCWTPIERLGQVSGWHYQGDHQPTLWRGTKNIGALTWSLSGQHNTNNALAALAAAEEVGISPEAGLDALNQFDGVKRRMQVRGVIDDITVYDDFAHHPTAIKTTLQGLRAKVPNARLLAVLEPRSNTMKRGDMATRLPEALADADHIFCYSPQEGEHSLGWDAQAILAPLQTAGKAVAVHRAIAPLVQAISHTAKPGDHIVIMSNGSFGGIHEQLLTALGQNQP